MKEKVNVTIHDLAKELAVSPSTISRALKDHPSIGIKTKNAVKQLAKLRGYRPNIMAVNLRSQQSKTIGVLISWINRPFYGNLISGIEAAARARGYNVIISQTTDDTEIEIAGAKTLYDMRICGLISCLSIHTFNYNHFKQFHQSDMPVIFVDKVPKEFAGRKIVIDNFKAAHQATTHLIVQGCKRLAHIGGSTKQEIYQDRLKGFTAAVENAGLKVDSELVIEGDNLALLESQKLAERILTGKVRPDGIFCANDTAAVSVMQFAKGLGMKVPEDLAIIGFNDDPICKIIDPQLSSMYHPAHEMGKLCVEGILDVTPGDSGSDKVTMLNAELKIRRSSLRR